MHLKRMSSAMALATVTALVAAGCGANGEEPEEVSSLTFWTAQTMPERVAAQEAIAARFAEKTGIDVEVVPLSGADQNTTLLANAAAGNVPDVILHGWEQSAAWVDQGMLDQDAAADIVESLGRDTFAQGALRMVEVDEKPSGVPMDGWGYLFLYRSDRFAELGLDAPESIQDLADAATALDEAGKGGVALGTMPGDGWTGETLQAVLLANGCELVADGEVDFTSQACVNGLEIYQQMAATAGAGEVDMEAARASFLAGQTSMLMFSSHILDEVAGLDPNNPVTCPECIADPSFLANNTGIATALSGPDNPTPVQFGNVLQLSIPTGAQTDAAKQFVEFLMTDGYVDSLAMATEGRIPVRLGTAENPTEFIDAWAGLSFGAGGDGTSIGDVFGADVARKVATGSESYRRWGAGTPDVLLTSLVHQQGVVQQNLGNLFTGGDASAVAQTIHDAIRSLQQEIQ